MEFLILIIKKLFKKFVHIREDLEIRGRITDSPNTSTIITIIILVCFLSLLKYVLNIILVFSFNWLLSFNIPL